MLEDKYYFSKLLIIKNREMKKGMISLVFTVSLVVLSLIGEVLCIYKAVKCNWNPIGKAEIFYTAAACSGLGAIVGWFDIEDR